MARTAQLVAVAGAIALAACGKGDGNEGASSASAGAGPYTLVVTAPDAKLKDQNVVIATGLFSTFTHSVMLDDGKSKAAAGYRFYLSDGPIKPWEPAEDKTLVYVQLTGPEGSDVSAPLPTGSYVAKKDDFTKDVFMKTTGLGVTPPKANGPKRDVSGFQGTVEITRSAAQEIEGTIDLKNGELSVKGRFKATKHDD